jgi:hypothetical protein
MLNHFFDFMYDHIFKKLSISLQTQSYFRKEIDKNFQIHRFHLELELKVVQNEFCSRAYAFFHCDNH